MTAATTGGSGVFKGTTDDGNTGMLDVGCQVHNGVEGVMEETWTVGSEVRNVTRKDRCFGRCSEVC